MAVETSQSAPVTTKLSYEEFLHWPGENQHVEWVDGGVVEMSPVSARYQLIFVFLIKLLDDFVQERNLGRILADPFQMKTGPELPGRAPDIIFVANESMDRLKDTYLDGPADLVVEIISPGSRGVDRGAKFYEYESGGVREYWLIDPERKVAEFYLRDESGIFRLIDERDAFHSSVLNGLSFDVAVLWQEPLPSARKILEQLQ
jgi:Uma2 family endonuclease